MLVPTIDLITVSDIWSTTIQDRLFYHTILQMSHFERVAQFAAESKLPFSITYTTSISKCSQFRPCGNFANANLGKLGCFGKEMQLSSKVCQSFSCIRASISQSDFKT
jgi:hypothetical protein